MLRTCALLHGFNHIYLDLATSALRGYHLLDKPLRLSFQPQHLRHINSYDSGGMSHVQLIL